MISIAPAAQAHHFGSPLFPWARKLQVYPTSEVAVPTPAGVMFEYVPSGPTRSLMSHELDAIIGFPRVPMPLTADHPSSVRARSAWRVVDHL